MDTMTGVNHRDAITGHNHRDTMTVGYDVVNRVVRGALPWGIIII